jgi:methyl acetate hydrolase
MITPRETPTGRGTGSWTWGGAFNTFFWVDPARRVAGVFLTQIRPFAAAGVLDLVAQFERAVYRAVGARHVEQGLRPA